MKRTFKYRMYPSKTAEKKLLETLEICRKTYNDLLEINIETYQNTGKGLTKFDMNKCINCMGGIDKSDVHSQVLQNVSDRLNKSFRNFFRRVKQNKGKAGFPRYKKDIKSFTYPQSGYTLNNHTLKLSKVGDVNLRIGRTQNKIKGEIKTLTVKRMPSGKWFVCIAAEINEEVIPTNNKAGVGIDLGLNKFVYDSDGNYFNHPRSLNESLKQLAREQRRMSRKTKGSKGRKKQRLRVARIHETITNQRNDFLHKLSKCYTDSYGIIAMEKLNIKGMVKNHHLARSINDASWGRFVQMLEYKASSAGVQVRKVDPKYTSQKCSQCGSIVKKSLAVRTHRCLCGFVADRDYNAANNILIRATAGTAERYADGDGSSLLGQIQEGSLSEKSEANGFSHW